jgi:hypothetical protein
MLNKPPIKQQNYEAEGGSQLTGEEGIKSGSDP